LTAVAFDLAPPVEEAQSLIRASVEPARARPVLEALATLHPLGVEVDDEGVKVHVALDLPPADTTPPPPEPPLAPMEMARWQQLLESWDGFLVFVVKDLGAAAADPGLRDELLDLLLASRHGLLDALAGGPVAGVDPVRELFHFHEPAPSESTPAPPPADESSWLGPRTAWAAPPPDELGTIARRLDRWLPRPDELTAYRDAVGRLLALVAGRTAGANAVEDRFARLYGVLVPAVAWQESCWRQFVERDGQVTYLLSK